MRRNADREKNRLHTIVTHLEWENNIYQKNRKRNRKNRCKRLMMSTIIGSMLEIWKYKRSPKEKSLLRFMRNSRNSNLNNSEGTMRMKRLYLMRSKE